MRIVCRTVPIHLQTPMDRQSPLVLCPGDPDRSERVARELLEGAELVTHARGLLGFTGRFKGVPVTVQTTGMGGGSTGIVIHELIELGAKTLIRAGTAGGLQTDIAPGSLIIADVAVADDGAGLSLAQGMPTRPSQGVLRALSAAAAASPRDVTTGTIVSTDVFYDLAPGRNEEWQSRGILAVEMEAAVLFSLAARHGVSAGCVVAVSNQLVGESPGWLSAEDREVAGIDVCRVALDALVGGS